MRFVGGASGSTVAGVIIGSGLIAIRQTRDGAPALADAASSDLAAGASIFDGVSRWAFAVAARLAAIAFIATLRMGSAPLRGALHAVRFRTATDLAHL
jgi:hypothetical protein